LSEQRLEHVDDAALLAARELRDGVEESLNMAPRSARAATAGDVGGRRPKKLIDGDAECVRHRLEHVTPRGLRTLLPERNVDLRHADELGELSLSQPGSLP
jgi:hypothetical protein